MSDLLQTLKESKMVAKELSLYLNKEKVNTSDFLLKFQVKWQIGYLLDFLYTRYQTILFVKEQVYVVFVRIGELDRIVVDERINVTNYTDSYMEAICAAIKYLEKPF